MESVLPSLAVVTGWMGWQWPRRLVILVGLWARRGGAVILQRWWPAPPRGRGPTGISLIRPVVRRRVLLWEREGSTGVTHMRGGALPRGRVL